MMRATIPLPDRISQDPDVMVGKPVVKGTRIPVERVIAHLARTPDLDDLFAAYPELTIEDVKAVLTYAHHAVNGRPAPTERRRSMSANAAAR